MRGRGPSRREKTGQWDMSGVLSDRDVLCCAQSLSRVLVFAAPWTAAHQAPLSLGILQARILEWDALLHGIFPTQELNPGLPHCRWILTI